MAAVTTTANDACIPPLKIALVVRRKIMSIHIRTYIRHISMENLPNFELGHKVTHASGS